MKGFCLRLVLVLSVALAFPTPAWADSPGTVRSARALGEEALRLFGEGRWREAYDLFKAANELLQAPTLVLYMARCKRNLGDLVAARGWYEVAARQSLPAGASSPFIQAKANAASELAELDRRIPSLSLVVTGPAAGSAVVTLDGVPVSDSRRPFFVNPGRRVLGVTAAGFLAETRVIDAEEGAPVQILTVALSLDPHAADRAGAAGPLWPGFVALGVGLAGVVTGAVAGAVASAKSSDIERQCVDGHCPSGLATAGDEAKTIADLSTTGFVVGGVGVALGAVLLVVRPGREASIDVGAGSFVVRGRF